MSRGRRDRSGGRIRVPAPKPRRAAPPPGRAHPDARKEARRRACRVKPRDEDENPP